MDKEFRGVKEDLDPDTLSQVQPNVVTIFANTIRIGDPRGMNREC